MKLQIKDDAGKVTKISIANRDEITIGRKEGNTVRLTERNVSRSHARFIKKGDEVHVEDLSRYGTRVNGDRIGVGRRVSDGDIIQIGDYELSFDGVKAIEPPPPEAAAPKAEPVVEAKKQTPADAKKQKEIEAKAKAQIAAAKAENAGGNKAENTVSIQAMPDEPGADRKSLGAGKKRIGAVHPTLVAVTSDIAGKEYALTSKTMIVGRTGENDIVIEHHSISRNHAKIVVDGAAVKMVDLQSKNGIRVNGELWEESVLKSGDVVELGKVQLRYVEKGEEFIYRPEDWVEGGRGQQAAVIDEPVKKKSKAWLFFLLLLVAGAVAAVFVVTQKPPVASNVGEPVAVAQPTPPAPGTDPVKPVEAVVAEPVKPVEPVVDAVPEPSNEDAVKEAIEKARSAVAAQSWEEALKQLEIVVVLDKSNEEAVRMKDTVLREQKIGEGFAMAQTSQNAKDLEAAWMALNDLGVVPETSVYYARVTELKNAVGPAIANARVDEAKGLLAKKQYNEAIDKGEEALALVDNLASARDVIAKARKAKADQQKADARPETPKPKTPTPNAATSNKSAADLYKEARDFHTSNPTKALELYKQAADKGHASAWKQMGSIKSKRGDIPGAIQAYEKYLKLAPNAGDAPMVRDVINKWNGN